MYAPFVFFHRAMECRYCSLVLVSCISRFFFFQAEDGIRDHCVTGVQTCALPIFGDVYAVALGSGAKAAAATLGKHGAKAVHVNEDSVFDDYIAEPATDALASLFEREKPDLILFGFTSDSREVAGRLAARLGVGLISNAADVAAKDGGFVAKVPYFGGAKLASMRPNGKPAIVLVRPKSFEPSESGGTADVKDLAISIGEGSKRAKIVERVAEASEK